MPQYGFILRKEIPYHSINLIKSILLVLNNHFFICVCVCVCLSVCIDVFVKWGWKGVEHLASVGSGDIEKTQT